MRRDGVVLVVEGLLRTDVPGAVVECLDVRTVASVVFGLVPGLLNAAGRAAIESTLVFPCGVHRCREPALE